GRVQSTPDHVAALTNGRLHGRVPDHGAGRRASHNVASEATSDAVAQALGARLAGAFRAGAFRAGAVCAAGLGVVAGRPGRVTASSALPTALPASATTSPAFSKVSLTSSLRRIRRTTSSPRWASDSYVSRAWAA